MLKNACLLAKIGADTAENERNLSKLENLPKIGNYPTGPKRLRRRGPLRASMAALNFYILHDAGRRKVTCGRNIFPEPKRSPTTFMPFISGPSMMFNGFTPDSCTSLQSSTMCLSIPFTYVFSNCYSNFWLFVCKL